jgi:hypothetical protein
VNLERSFGNLQTVLKYCLKNKWVKVLKTEFPVRSALSARWTDTAQSEHIGPCWQTLRKRPRFAERYIRQTSAIPVKSSKVRGDPIATARVTLHDFDTPRERVCDYS